MKYVLDSSVALKWVLAEVDSHRAIRLRDRYLAGDIELVAPDIFLTEIANALASAERQNRIGVGESAIFLNDMLSITPVLHSTAPLLIRAMELAIASKHAVYDCVYVAMAEMQGCEFVTADEQLVRTFSKSHPIILLRSQLP